MSRRKAAPKRPILPDPLFGNKGVARFINVVMHDGKKSVAEKIVYGALEKVVERTYRKKSDDDSDGGSGGSAGSSPFGAPGLRPPVCSPPGMDYAPRASPDTRRTA